MSGRSRYQKSTNLTSKDSDGSKCLCCSVLVECAKAPFHIDHPFKVTLLEHAPKIVNRFNTRSTKKFPSLKMGKMLECRSVAQVDALRLLEADPHVSVIRVLQCEIDYTLGDKVNRHYPDFCLKVDGRNEIWDVVPTQDPSVEARTDLLRRGLANVGYLYRNVTESEIEKQPRLRNVQVILQFGRQQYSVIEREAIRRFFKRFNSVSWDEVVKGVYGEHGRELICRLLLEGRLVMDLGQPLLPSTRFHMSEGGL